MIWGFLILTLPFIAIISFVIYGLIYLVTKKRIGKRTVGYHLTRYVFIGYCFSLLYLTILWYYPYINFHPDYYMYNLKPFIWVSEVYAMGWGKMIEQLLLNIGMFIPYGILLPMVFVKFRKMGWTMLTVLATTVGIETFQFFIGRSADVDDVIMNLAGGFLGYVCFSVFSAIRLKK